MIKSVRVPKIWFESVRDEQLRFLIVDNTELQLNRGDFVNISCPETEARFHGCVIFVTSYGQAPGWVAFGFQDVDSKKMMSASLVAGTTVAQTINEGLRREAARLKLSDFESQEDFNEYKRLTRKMNENTSKKPTLQMQNRYQEFKSEREKIKIKTKRERENG